MRKWLKRILLGGLLTLGLLLVVAVVAYFIWQKSVEERLAYWRGELEAMGRPMTLEEIIPEPIPDEQNAAIPTLELIDLYEQQVGLAEAFDDLELEVYKQQQAADHQKSSRSDDFNRYVLNSKPNELERVTSYLNEDIQKKATAFFHEIGLRSHFYLARDYSNQIDNTVITPLHNYTQIIQYIQFKSVLSLKYQEMDRAYGLLTASLLHPQAFTENALLVDLLIRQSITDRFIETTRFAFEEYPPAIDLSKSILSTLNLYGQPDQSMIFAAMDRERLLAEQFIFSVAENNSDDPEIDQPLLFNWYYRDGWAKLLELYAIIAEYEMEKDGSRDGLYRKMQASVDGWTGSLLYTEVAHFPNQLESISNRVLKVSTQFNLLRADLALYIHKLEVGSYPESLEALVPVYLDELPYDPFADAPLTYSRTGDTYELYSVGAVDGERIHGQPIPLQ